MLTMHTCIATSGIVGAMSTDFDDARAFLAALDGLLQTVAKDRRAELVRGLCALFRGRRATIIGSTMQRKAARSRS
jgi:hypothetical protein